jgi:hypothetical protein
MKFQKFFIEGYSAIIKSALFSLLMITSIFGQAVNDESRTFRVTYNEKFSTSASITTEVIKNIFSEKNHSIEKIFFPAGLYKINSITFPDSIDLFLDKEAVLDVQALSELIIFSRNIITDISEHFRGDGKVVLKNTSPIFPEWFGADAFDLTSDSKAINKSIFAADKNAVIQLQKGTYWIDDSIEVKSFIKLNGDGIYSTILKRKECQANKIEMIGNWKTGKGSEIVISNLTLDGNSQNNFGVEVQYGLNLFGVTNCIIENVAAKNMKGKSPDGKSESVGFQIANSNDVIFNNCLYLGGDSTVSGFSADNSQNIIYSNCISKSCAIGHGFTHNSCDNITYSNCISYRNKSGYGFNSEISNNIIFNSCIAGGENNGNSIGFVLNSDTIGIILNNCIASNNGSGLFIYSSANSIKGIYINGGFYINNQNYGITSSDSVKKGVWIEQPVLFGNGVGNVYLFNRNYPTPPFQIGSYRWKNNFIDSISVEGDSVLYFYRDGKRGKLSLSEIFFLFLIGIPIFKKKILNNKL